MGSCLSRIGLNLCIDNNQVTPGTNRQETFNDLRTGSARTAIPDSLSRATEAAAESGRSAAVERSARNPSGSKVDRGDVRSPVQRVRGTVFIPGSVHVMEPDEAPSQDLEGKAGGEELASANLDFGDCDDNGISAMPRRAVSDNTVPGQRIRYVVGIPLHIWHACHLHTPQTIPAQMPTPTAPAASVSGIAPSRTKHSHLDCERTLPPSA